jgi:ABC-type transporter Mla subunit MlaD
VPDESPLRLGDLAPAANEPGSARPTALKEVDADALPAVAALLAAPAAEFRERLDALAARTREESSKDIRHALQTAAQVLGELRRREERP